MSNWNDFVYASIITAVVLFVLLLLVKKGK